MQNLYRHPTFRTQGIYRCKVADAASLEVKVGQSVVCASLHAENNFELNCF